jgi:ATP-binding cassette subfamily B protein
MGPGAFGGPPPFKKPEPTVKPPKSISDLPRYISEIIGGFFSRLFYICGIVWKTSPFILVSLVIVSLLEGVLPIISSLLSRDIMNELQVVITQNVASEVSGGTFTAVFFGSSVMLLLIFFFINRILTQLLSRFNAAITRIAGEKVTRYVKVPIMNKAKEIDLSSFDLPEFYEKLENANREAGV